MTRALLMTALSGALLASSAAAAGPALDEGAFRYERALRRVETGPAVIEPDARLFAHTRPGFADLRVVTADGRQVAWRPMPDPPAVERRPLAVVYGGVRDGEAVALLDAGSARPALERLELDIPDSDFVGRAVVLGSDDRTTFTKLSSTVVFDIAGAASARSTVAVFPLARARYYLVRVGGVSAVTGARAVVASGRARPVVARAVRQVTVSQRPRRTVVTLDLGFSRVPVDRLRITATTPVYDRTVEIEESAGGRAWRWAASGRAFRLPDSVEQQVDVATASRYVRVVVENGDDAPLAGIRVAPLAASRALLLRGGDPGPLRLLYGNRTLRAPQYDFAQLPEGSLDLGSAEPARLGAERRVPASIPPPDVESFFEQHGWLVPALLGLAALGIGAVGLVAALKPRRPSGRGGAPAS